MVPYVLATRDFFCLQTIFRYVAFPANKQLCKLADVVNVLSKYMNNLDTKANVHSHQTLPAS
jgi:hypothetical protein